MRTLSLKPNHKWIAAYHALLTDFARLGVKHETARYNGLLAKIGLPVPL
jgi:hypothetical protein